MPPVARTPPSPSASSHGHANVRRTRSLRDRVHPRGMLLARLRPGRPPSARPRTSFEPSTIVCFRLAISLPPAHRSPHPASLPAGRRLPSPLVPLPSLLDLSPSAPSPSEPPPSPAPRAHFRPPLCALAPARASHACDFAPLRPCTRPLLAWRLRPAAPPALAPLAPDAWRALPPPFREPPRPRYIERICARHLTEKRTSPDAALRRVEAGRGGKEAREVASRGDGAAWDVQSSQDGFAGVVCDAESSPGHPGRRQREARHARTRGGWQTEEWAGDVALEEMEQI